MVLNQLYLMKIFMHQILSKNLTADQHANLFNGPRMYGLLF